MNKTFFIAWIAVFILWFLGSFLVHGQLLHGEYLQLTGLFRTEAEAQDKFALMLLAHVILAGAFVWIYSRGVEATGWVGQGLRYGLAIALLTAVPMYMIYYVVQPMPGELVVKQIVLDSIVLLVLGLVVAFIYSRGAQASPGT